MFKEILEKIKEFDTIIIHRHLRPDGDCIGSQFGLKYLIEENFPEKTVYAVGDQIPDYLSFIGENNEISADIYKEALVIVVDTSIKSRICDERYALGKYIIKIDHHDDSEEFGDIICVKNEEPANCQIITEFAVYNNLEISKKAAVALYTGLITDTGRFQFRGVSQATFNAAGVLVNAGIDVDKIYAYINLKDINSYKLQAYLYKNMKMTPNGVVYMYFTNKIMKKFKVTKDEAAALVSCMSSIKGSLFWITFVDYDENIRVRLRSRFMSINELGKKWRGGGHLQAAGATIYNKKEMKELLKEADELIKKYKEENPEAI